MGSKVIRNITKVFRSASGVLFGRSTAGTGRGEELTPSQVRSLLSVYTVTQTDTAISTAVNTLIGGAPGLLDTLDELSAALGDDANFAATVTNALSGKVDSSSLSESIDDRVAALLVAGTNISLTYNDASNTLTVASTGGGIGGSTGGTTNRVLTANGTGGATLQACPVTIDSSGNVTGVVELTASGVVTHTGNSAVSAPVLPITGTWYSGGTTTTTKPHVLIEPTGTTSNAWSTIGTGLGVNAASGFNGDLLALALNGAKVYQLGVSSFLFQSGGTGTKQIEINSGIGTVLRWNTSSLIIDSSNITSSTNLVVSTAGKGLQLKSGTGARAGNATLVAGTVTVTNTTVTANTIVYLTRKTAGGTIGNLSYTLSAGASFTINSDSASDTSVISYILIELN